MILIFINNKKSLYISADYKVSIFISLCLYSEFIQDI